MKIMKPAMCAFFAVTCLYFLTGCSSDNTSTDHKLPILGRMDYVEKKVGDKIVIDTVYHQVADFQFVDQDSSIITPQTFENKIYVTDFFFTSCPTICPVMKKQMLRVYGAFENNNEVALLSHTIDPEYDTVALLHEYAQRLGVKSDKWHFVTGEKDAIYETAQKSYMVTADEDSNAPGGFIHSGAFILVDKDRRIRGIYDGTKPEEVDQMMQDMQRLLQEYTNTEV